MLQIPHSTIKAADYSIKLCEMARRGDILRNVKKLWDMFREDSLVRKRMICGTSVAEAMERLMDAEMREGGKGRVVDTVGSGGYSGGGGSGGDSRKRWKADVGGTG